MTWKTALLERKSIILRRLIVSRDGTSAVYCNVLRVRGFGGRIHLAIDG